MFKRILVPLDGSETAEKVLPLVVEEAKLHEADVVLLRVIAPLRQALMASPNVIAQIFKELELLAQEYLEEVSKKIRSEGLEVETIVERGQPALQTHKIAQNKSCNLIIVGTHGENDNPQWRIGSTANKIIRAQSLIPVLLIKTQSPK